MERNIRQPVLGFDRRLLREDFHAAALGFDFGFGRRAERMGDDRELFGQLAVAENLDAVAVAINQANGTQGRFVHTSAVVKHVQFRNINRQADRGELGVIETAFRDAANERHLTAFEADADGTARSRGLALATATGGFAATAGFALTEPFGAVLGTGTRFEIVQTHKN